MTASVYTVGTDMSSVSDKAIKLAGRLWFLVAVLGQWIFAAYVAAFYGRAALGGDLAAWNKRMTHGHVAGDTVGNLVIALHLLLAMIVIVGGPLQLIPYMRAHAPSFHRWNGRVYLPAVFATSIAGLYMLWFRGTVGDLGQHLGMTLDAVLIMVFSVLVVRDALVRNLQSHRRWALRLFMVVNGVWFFRIGLMFWIVLNRGPVGFDPKTFTGPFLTVLSFADYLIPLAALELYLRMRESSAVAGRLAVAGGLFILTVAMGVGIAAATMIMWLPRIR